MGKKEHIVVIGGLGNMGRRYRAILDTEGISNSTIDIGTKQSMPANTTGIIVATPTDTHITILRQIKDFGFPILCEKPISKDRVELDEILQMPCKLRMVNQYEFFIADKKTCKIVYQDPSVRDIKTIYDYYHSGKDDLQWDCINLIGLSEPNARIELRNKSPIWKCSINGVKLDKNKIDLSYVWNIKDWLEKYDDNKKYIKKAHDRVIGNNYVI